MNLFRRGALAASFAPIAAALVATALIPTSAAAQRADCDFVYVIQDGDTLAEIAETAFGRRSYTLIYARNIAKIPNPAELPVGEEITIPCLPGDAAQTPDAAALSERMARYRSEEEAPAAGGEDQAAPSEDAVADSPAAAPALRFLTASGQPPFADESLSNGGMAAELTARALKKAIEPEDFEIVFINDRAKHLKELLQKGSFAAAFPWIRPPCDRIERLRELAPADASMCEAMTFSDPYYEVVYGFFVRRGAAPERRAFADFATATICRPAGLATLDLNVAGIAEPAATFIRPESAAACLELLFAGEADAVSADAFEVEAAMAEMGVEDEVEELPELGLVTAYVAVAPKDKPAGAMALDALNRGMLELKLSGEWSRVVARHLARN